MLNGVRVRCIIFVSREWTFHLYLFRVDVWVSIAIAKLDNGVYAGLFFWVQNPTGKEVPWMHCLC